MAIPWRDPTTAPRPARRPRWSRRALIVVGIAVLLTWVFALLAVLHLDRQSRVLEKEAEALKAEIGSLASKAQPPVDLRGNGQ
jgi:hypothetical protein